MFSKKFFFRLFQILSSYSSSKFWKFLLQTFYSGFKKKSDETSNLHSLYKISYFSQFNA